jgi:hypothetical protein
MLLKGDSQSEGISKYKYLSLILILEKNPKILGLMLIILVGLDEGRSILSLTVIPDRKKPIHSRRNSVLLGLQTLYSNIGTYLRVSQVKLDHILDLSFSWRNDRSLLKYASDHYAGEDGPRTIAILLNRPFFLHSDKF